MPSTTPITADAVYGSIHDAIAYGEARTIVPYRASGPDDINEFCLFLKPELTALPLPGLATAFGIVIDALHAHAVEVSAAAVIPGQVLDESGMIRAHYGVIDDVARRGTAAFSPEAASAFKLLVEESEVQGAPVLGGFQLLELYPYFTPAALAVLYDNLVSTRLSGGTHGAVANIRGNRVVVLNGFHPDQIERYTARDASIVALVCRTRTPWRVLRQEMTGSTNPVAAVSGSIRRTILERQDEVGLREFNAGMNGVHVSAGAVEGMVEIARYFSGSGSEVKLVTTTFGQLLASMNLPEESLAKLAANPTSEFGGRTAPLFDMTEEVDAFDAAAIVREFVDRLSG
ncbi:MAG TPA: hypothetical protein VNA20_16240 [Frankiaceae bacterium]|nr:hypothetical protein [Frankiaceae bacterium]